MRIFLADDSLAKLGMCMYHNVCLFFIVNLNLTIFPTPPLLYKFSFSNNKHLQAVNAQGHRGHGRSPPVPPHLRDLVSICSPVVSLCGENLVGVEAADCIIKHVNCVSDDCLDAISFATQQEEQHPYPFFPFSAITSDTTVATVTSSSVATTSPSSVATTAAPSSIAASSASATTPTSDDGHLTNTTPSFPFPTPTDTTSGGDVLPCDLNPTKSLPPNGDKVVILAFEAVAADDSRPHHHRFGGVFFVAAAVFGIVVVLCGCRVIRNIWKTPGYPSQLLPTSNPQRAGGLAYDYAPVGNNASSQIPVAIVVQHQHRPAGNAIVVTGVPVNMSS